MRRPWERCGLALLLLWLGCAAGAPAPCAHAPSRAAQSNRGAASAAHRCQPHHPHPHHHGFQSQPEGRRPEDTRAAPCPVHAGPAPALCPVHGAAPATCSVHAPRNVDDMTVRLAGLRLAEHAGHHQVRISRNGSTIALTIGVHKRKVGAAPAHEQARPSEGQAVRAKDNEAARSVGDASCMGCEGGRPAFHIARCKGGGCSGSPHFHLVECKGPKGAGRDAARRREGPDAKQGLERAREEAVKKREVERERQARMAERELAKERETARAREAEREEMRAERERARERESRAERERAQEREREEMRRAEHAGREERRKRVEQEMRELFPDVLGCQGGAKCHEAPKDNWVWCAEQARYVRF